MNTGTTISGRPSMGSWVTYGLGSDADDLPGFVVLTAGMAAAARCSRSPRTVERRLPAQPLPGVHLRGQGDPVLYLSRPGGVDESGQRDVVDAVQKLNAIHNNAIEDLEIATT